MRLAGGDAQSRRPITPCPGAEAAMTGGTYVVEAGMGMSETSSPWTAARSP
ncbi:MAG: hypothetical protein ACLSGS_08195 [Adlercreutzia sp.]